MYSVLTEFMFESFKVAFSGLRGGIAFGMIYSLQIQNRMMYIQTTLIIIFFTVFIQGSSVGPLLNFLKGTRRNLQDLNEKKSSGLVCGCSIRDAPSKLTS